MTAPGGSIDGHAALPLPGLDNLLEFARDAEDVGPLALDGGPVVWRGLADDEREELGRGQVEREGLGRIRSSDLEFTLLDELPGLSQVGGVTGLSHGRGRR